MKIPFDIKFKPQIESGEYKVVIEYDNRTFYARIVCWDFNSTELLACVNYGDREDVLEYDSSGKHIGKSVGRPDLIIITPEPELSEFEKGCIRLYQEGRDDGFAGDNLSDEILKESAAELLTLAREQFIKDGYVIEKKAFHDAVEKIDNKHKAEMSVEYSIHCKVKDGTRHAIMNWDTFQKVAQKFIDMGKAEAVEKYKQSWFNEGKIAGRFEGLSEDKKYQQGVRDGKAEALKDLPRWKKITFREDMSFVGCRNECELFHKGRVIALSDLEKLPGFNE